jgi:four helix bundle protein
MNPDLSISKFELYVLAREYSKAAWAIYTKLPVYIQMRTGGQFLESADSVQANIVEAQGRFHFKDKRNFEYHARGSLLESLSWADILRERGFVQESDYLNFIGIGDKITFKLNSHIKYLTTQSSIRETS